MIIAAVQYNVYPKSQGFHNDHHHHHLATQDGNMYMKIHVK